MAAAILPLAPWGRHVAAAWGLIAVVCLLSRPVAPLGAQDRPVRERPAQERPIVIRGSVRDQAGAPISGADVRIVAGRDSSLARASSDQAGRFRIAARPPAGARGARDYELVVRRIGHSPERRAIRAAPGDSVELSLTLRTVPVRLAPVEVTGQRRRQNPAYAIDAAQIAAYGRGNVRTALDVVARLRPDMRGDDARFCDRLKHVWVNGERVSVGREPTTVLREIRVEHVAEMRYVNCWDTEMPGVSGRDAVYVVLKPGVRYVPFRGTELVVSDSGG